MRCEGNLLVPLLHRAGRQLPPVLGLVSVVIFASLFGLPGILFATPLMVSEDMRCSGPKSQPKGKW
jgi:predicted PurR-regulated permease PerM